MPSTIPAGGASASPPLGPIRIAIGGQNSQPFKSIDNLLWEDVPPFAVLTGLNGSGKTQLLELLAYRLTQTRHPQLGDLGKVLVNITGDTFSPDSVAFIPSQWEIGGAPVLGLAQLQDAKRNLYSQLQRHQIEHDMVRRAMRGKLERLLGVQNLEQLGAEAFAKRLPDDFAFMLNEVSLTAGLTHVFLAYRVRTAEALEKGQSREETAQKLGPAPWDVLNQMFQAAEFTYRVVSPLETGLLDTYEILLEDPSTGHRIQPTDLSSGEKTLLALVLWLYNSQHHGQFPRLFLLDEPDAHLHPSMTRHLLNVIKNVLVERHDVRTILTTHSPSTVALAPADALFEMSKQQPRVVRSRSQAATIGLLTAGLITVSPNTRYVLVEDEDDVKFYSAVRDLLLDYGPSRDPRAIKPAPSIVFLPASNGAGKAKIGGGKTVVIPWVEKFDQAPLNELVRGIIDRDISNSGTARVYPVGRYSIENYLLDPLVVFGALLDAGRAPVIPNVAISVGDEYLLRSMSVMQLQSIVNTIRGTVESRLVNLTSFEVMTTAVVFTNTKVLQYPLWMIDRRGHDLLPLYQAAFGGPTVLTPPKLERSFRRIRLIPKELADIMDKLQS
ncbi:AAA ATPase [Chthoniobacter flavus Ellin428]|uniref:AAA ATPase n=1 Tax=Chthoniobacter flavus Ellin428 TaxID=497964 RepID=B4D306_9BACT|nr:ATP-binding protein [Chthoniobacter flavus]EDY19117.1 AAA ATPase [Chthoniobacter flavus Ellin428]TCO87966.1 putative AbiEii toxin of type IV toxin-antitoxin system [Chthoniobacter flavus]